MLVLDEPTIGLDPIQIREIRALIQQLAGERTIILSTHILPEVSQICEKVVIINEGQVVLEQDMASLKSGGTLEDVFLRAIAKTHDAHHAGEATGMRNVFTIAGREIRSYFVSPIAYVVLTGFLLLGGWFFFNLLARFNMLLTIYSAQQNPQVLERLNLNEFVIAPLLHNLSVILVILVPVITMRSLAEEKKAGTYELLLTSPLRISEIVLGKFLGAFLFVAIMVATTGVYALILMVYGNPEMGVILGRLSRPAAARDGVRRGRRADLVVHREPDHRRGELSRVAAAALHHRLARR